MKYSEIALAIDLISMEYETKDPDFICRIALQELDTYVTPGNVKDHFNYTEDYEHISHTIEWADIN